MEYRVSYAQNREDILIGGFFPDVSAGHYVDVGASHPVDLSVTKLFYDQGWTGLNVEPIPALAEALRTERPHDVTVQAALAAEAGETTLREYAGHGLSTVSTGLMASHEENPTEWTTDFTEYTVPVLTLASVLEDHPLPHIHFLKIDAEGGEYEVLRGNDWERFRPELICIETEHVQRDWMGILVDAGYEQVFHDGLNAYLLATESLHRAAQFNYADVMLARPMVVTPVAAAEFESVAQLRDDTVTLQGEKLELERERLDLQTANLALQNENLALQDARLQLRADAIAEHEAVVGLQAENAELRKEMDDLRMALAAEMELRTLYAARDEDLNQRLAITETTLAGILGSQSWRMTYPIRRSLEMLRARAPRRLLTYVWRRWRARAQTTAVASTTVALAGTDGAEDPPTLSLEGRAVLDDLLRMGPEA